MSCPRCGKKNDNPDWNGLCDDCWSNQIVKKMLADIKCHPQSFDEAGDPVEPYAKGYRSLGTHQRLRQMGLI